jgi:hypothetical protein
MITQSELIGVTARQHAIGESVSAVADYYQMKGRTASTVERQLSCAANLGRAFSCMDNPFCT